VKQGRRPHRSGLGSCSDPRELRAVVSSPSWGIAQFANQLALATGTALASFAGLLAATLAGHGL